VVGAAAALLHAPSSGEDLLKNIKTQVDAHVARVLDEWKKRLQVMNNSIVKIIRDLQALEFQSKETNKSA